VKPLGDNGRHVVKDQLTGRYFQLGEHESFLLLRLDGEMTAEQVCQAFSEQFNENFTPDDLNGFLTVADAQGLLVADPTPDFEESDAETISAKQAGQANSVPVTSMPNSMRQSIFFWRKPLFDPDRFFNYLCPKIWFVWTPYFVVASVFLVIV